MKTPSTSGQAVVIGAGFAGLVAAAALAPHFRRVIVLERDALSSEVGNRLGTPQDSQLHGLVTGGQYALERFFRDSRMSSSPLAQ